MSTIFGNGQMENIPVGVVDEDNTSMSREVVRTVEAVPTFKVTPLCRRDGSPVCYPIERDIRLPRDPHRLHG